MTVKEQLEQRAKDLKGNKARQGEFIEQTALLLLHRDLTTCAAIARDIVTGSGETDPDVADVLAVHELYQAYLGPSYQYLLANGDIDPPAVQTNNTASVRTKDQLDS